MSAFKAPTFLDGTFETSWQDSSIPTLKDRLKKQLTYRSDRLPGLACISYGWLHACCECLYSWGAYFRVGAYTREALVRSGYGCLYSWGAYSLWVLIIPSIRYTKIITTYICISMLGL